VGKTVNKADIVEAVATKTGMSKKEAGPAVDAVLGSITEALAVGDKVQLTGFGAFQVRERSARMARNPRTGASVRVAATRIPAFKAGKALKDAVK